MFKSLDKELKYRISSVSSTYTYYTAQNIQIDDPKNVNSRWTTAFNNSDQFLVLELESESIITGVYFGKFHKPHVCNVCRFAIFSLFVKKEKDVCSCDCCSRFYDSRSVMVGVSDDFEVGQSVEAEILDEDSFINGRIQKRIANGVESVGNDGNVCSNVGSSEFSRIKHGRNHTGANCERRAFRSFGELPCTVGLPEIDKECIGEGNLRVIDEEIYRTPNRLCRQVCSERFSHDSQAASEDIDVSSRMNYLDDVSTGSKDQSDPARSTNNQLRDTTTGSDGLSDPDRSINSHSQDVIVNSNGQRDPASSINKQLQDITAAKNDQSDPARSRNEHSEYISPSSNGATHVDNSHVDHPQICPYKNIIRLNRKPHLICEGSLRNDNKGEYFSTNTTLKNCFITSNAIKICPLSCYGVDMKFSIWHVKLFGVDRQDVLMRVNLFNTLSIERYCRKMAEKITETLRNDRSGYNTCNQALRCNGSRSDSKTIHNPVNTPQTVASNERIESPRLLSVKASENTRIVGEDAAASNSEYVKKYSVPSISDDEVSYIKDVEVPSDGANHIYMASSDASSANPVYDTPAQCITRADGPKVITQPLNIGNEYETLYSKIIFQLERKDFRAIESMFPNPERLSKHEQEHKFVEIKPDPTDPWPEERGGFASTIHDSKIYISGGWCGKDIMKDLWVFDCETEKFSILSSSDKKRSCHSLVYVSASEDSLDDFSNHSNGVKDLNDVDDSRDEDVSPKVAERFETDEDVIMFTSGRSDSYSDQLVDLECAKTKETLWNSEKWTTSAVHTGRAFTSSEVSLSCINLGFLEDLADTSMANGTNNINLRPKTGCNTSQAREIPNDSIISPNIERDFFLSPEMAHVSTIPRVLLRKMFLAQEMPSIPSISPRIGQSITPAQYMVNISQNLKVFRQNVFLAQEMPSITSITPRIGQSIMAAQDIASHPITVTRFRRSIPQVQDSPDISSIPGGLRNNTPIILVEDRKETLYSTTGLDCTHNISDCPAPQTCPMNQFPSNFLVDLRLDQVSTDTPSQFPCNENMAFSRKIFMTYRKHRKENTQAHGEYLRRKIQGAKRARNLKMLDFYYMAWYQQHDMSDLNAFDMIHDKNETGYSPAVHQKIPARSAYNRVSIDSRPLRYKEDSIWRGKGTSNAKFDRFTTLNTRPSNSIGSERHPKFGLYADNLVTNRTRKQYDHVIRNSIGTFFIQTRSILQFIKTLPHWINYINYLSISCLAQSIIQKIQLPTVATIPRQKTASQIHTQLCVTNKHDKVLFHPEQITRNESDPDRGTAHTIRKCSINKISWSYEKSCEKYGSERIERDFLHHTYRSDTRSSIESDTCSISSKNTEAYPHKKLTLYNTNRYFTDWLASGTLCDLGKVTKSSSVDSDLKTTIHRHHPLFADRCLNPHPFLNSGLRVTADPGLLSEYAKLHGHIHRKGRFLWIERLKDAKTCMDFTRNVYDHFGLRLINGSDLCMGSGYQRNNVDQGLSGVYVPTDHDVWGLPNSPARHYAYNKDTKCCLSKLARHPKLPKVNGNTYSINRSNAQNRNVRNNSYVSDAKSATLPANRVVDCGGSYGCRALLSPELIWIWDTRATCSRNSKFRNHTDIHLNRTLSNLERFITLNTPNGVDFRVTRKINPDGISRKRTLLNTVRCKTLNTKGWVSRIHQVRNQTEIYLNVTSLDPAPSSTLKVRGGVDFRTNRKINHDGVCRNRYLLDAGRLRISRSEHMNSHENRFQENQGINCHNYSLNRARIHSYKINPIKYRISNEEIGYTVADPNTEADNSSDEPTRENTDRSNTPYTTDNRPESGTNNFIQVVSPSKINDSPEDSYLLIFGGYIQNPNYPEKMILTRFDLRTKAVNFITNYRGPKNMFDNQLVAQKNNQTLIFGGKIQKSNRVVNNGFIQLTNNNFHEICDDGSYKQQMEHRSGHAMVLVHNDQHLDDFQKFDPNQSYECVNRLVFPREFIIVIGGSLDNKFFYDLKYYCTKENTVFKTVKLPKEIKNRVMVRAQLVGDKIYMMFCYNTDVGSETNEMQIYTYDVYTLRFEKLVLPQPKPCPRSAHCFLFCEKSHCIYIFGGNRARKLDSRLNDMWKLMLPQVIMAERRNNLLLRKIRHVFARIMRNDGCLKANEYIRNNVYGLYDLKDTGDSKEFKAFCLNIYIHPNEYTVVNAANDLVSLYKAYFGKDTSYLTDMYLKQ